MRIKSIISLEHALPIALHNSETRDDRHNITDGTH